MVINRRRLSNNARIARVVFTALLSIAYFLIYDVNNKYPLTPSSSVPPRYVPEKKGSQHRDDLVQAFSSQPHQEYFHKISSLSAEGIAARYGIPQTDRSVECNLNGTTQVG